MDPYTKLFVVKCEQLQTENRELQIKLSRLEKEYAELLEWAKNLEQVCSREQLTEADMLNKNTA